MTVLEKAKRIAASFKQTAADDLAFYGSAYSPLSEREMDALLMFDDARKLDQHFTNIDEAMHQYALRHAAFIESLNGEQMGHYFEHRMRFDDEDEHTSLQTDGSSYPKGNDNFEAYAQDVLQGKDFSGTNGYAFFDSLTPAQRADNWVLSTLATGIRDHKKFHEEFKPGNWGFAGSLFYGGERNVLLNPDFAKKSLSIDVADKDYDGIEVFERALSLSGQLRENPLEGEESGYFFKQHVALLGPQAHTLHLVGLEGEPDIDFDKIAQKLDGQIKQELLTSVKPRPSSHGPLYEFTCPYGSKQQTDSEQFILHMLRFHADPRENNGVSMFVRSGGENYTLMDAIQAQAAAGDQIMEAAIDSLDVPRYPYMDPKLPNLNDAQYVIQFKGQAIQKILAEQVGMDIPTQNEEKEPFRRYG